MDQHIVGATMQIVQILPHIHSNNTESKTNTEMLRILYFELELFPLSEYWTVEHIKMRSFSHFYPFVSSPHW